MLTIAPMTEDDLQALYAHSPEALWDNFTTRWRDCQGINLCMRKDADYLAWGGITVLWSGVGNAWLHTTPLAYTYRLSLYREMIWQFHRMATELNLHRVEADIVAYAPKSLRLARHLPLVCEGLMRQYGSDRSDYYKYRWLRTDPVKKPVKDVGGRWGATIRS
jgi:hypothetical protein